MGAKQQNGLTPTHHILWHNFLPSLHPSLPTKDEFVAHVNWLGNQHVSWINSMLTMNSLSFSETVREILSMTVGALPVMSPRMAVEISTTKEKRRTELSSPWL